MGAMGSHAPRLDWLDLQEGCRCNANIAEAQLLMSHSTTSSAPRITGGSVHEASAAYQKTPPWWPHKARSKGAPTQLMQ